MRACGEAMASSAANASACANASRICARAVGAMRARRVRDAMPQQHEGRHVN
jgi:hypothetical protein